ncbi:Uncharacterised protein [Klebsiella pneumoniae]|nr:Uncharacterised protein [Klebsiella pneumoniae]
MKSFQPSGLFQCGDSGSLLWRPESGLTLAFLSHTRNAEFQSISFVPRAW